MVALELSLCIILGVTFLISAVPKLRHPRGFVLTVLDYSILPLPVASLCGWLLPPLELLIALLLLTGTALSVAAIVASLLLISFIFAVSTNIMRGRDMDCHCFGTKARRTIGWPLIVEDSLLLCGAAIMACLTSSSLMTLAPWSLFRTFGSENSSIWPLLLNLAFTGCIAAVLRFLKPKRRWFIHTRFSAK